MLADVSVAPVSLRAFFENTVFLSSFTSLCVAQVLKGLICILSGRAKKAGDIFSIVMWRTGGMPSSHSALVCSLCASIAFSEGVTSNIFIFSMWFALVVLRDAMGVRRSAGLSARALNNLGRAVSDRLGIDFHAVKEVQGHTPLEVIMGGLLGIFISAGLFLL